MKTLTLVLALASVTALAYPAGELTFLTRDGRTLRGRILAETPQGYLVAGPKRTELLLYGNISDMRATEDQAQLQPVPPPPPPAPPAVAAAPEPLQAPQYPQPVRPLGWVQPPPAVGSSGVEEVPPASTRLGFHVGVGGGLLYLPIGYGVFTANAQLNLDWTFGVVGIRISPTLTYYQYYNAYVAISADTKVHFNIGDIFALGVGLDLGGAPGGGGGLYLGASVAPAIFKLGSRGQHQLALQVSVPVIVTTPRWSYFGMPMASLGYNYLF